MLVCLCLHLYLDVYVYVYSSVGFIPPTIHCPNRPDISKWFKFLNWTSPQGENISAPALFFTKVKVYSVVSVAVITVQ